MVHQREYVLPQYKVNGFNCPHCGAFAHQDWLFNVVAGDQLPLMKMSLSLCARCRDYALWNGGELFYPDVALAPYPATDMPEDVKLDYEEARLISGRSSRGAAALLRLATQKLVIALGEDGDNLNKGIGHLVKKGLPVDIQKALDVVRVIGNNAVHPGVMDIRDNQEIALALFKLVNLIVEQMITQPREVDELFSALPSDAKDAISKRDEAK